MEPASGSETPSDVRRLRAARLNFEAPSFSLGIDTETFRPIPSFDEFPENSSGRAEDFRSSPPVDESAENRSGRGEGEVKICKSVEKIIVSDFEDGIEDFQISGSQQQRCLKRLKRGPSSDRKESLKGARNQSRITDVFGRKLSKDSSEFSSQLHYGKCKSSEKTENSSLRKKDLSIFSTPLNKEPLPFIKGFRNQVPEGLKGAGIKSIDSSQEFVRTGGGNRVPSSTSDHRSGMKRSEPERSLASAEIAQCSRDFCSREVPRIGLQREGGSTGSGLIFNREPLSSAQKDTIDPFAKGQASPNGKADVVEDEIEEFSDDELFGSGSRTPSARRRSLRPQMSGLNLVLLASSPDTSQKTSQKPILHIPGADLPPQAPLRLSQPTETTTVMPNSEDDPFSLDDFVSGSGWRRTKPDLSKSGKTPQHLDNPTSESKRDNSVPHLFKNFQRDLFRDTNLKTFYTETPARRDIVGPSQALSNETEEDRIQAFLRQRFSHYKPVDDLLVDGGLDNEPVYIDYRRQFAEGRGSTQPNTGMGRRWPPVRSINEAFLPSIPAQRRNVGKKKAKPKSQPKKSKPGKASSSGERNLRPGKRGPGGSGEGKWRTVNGSRVYIVGNEKLSGRRAYSAYKKRAGNSSTKKNKKRPSAKSK